MSAPLYSDLYKNVKKVLEDPYKETISFKSKTKPNADLELEVNAERKDGPVVGSLAWKQKFAKNKGKYTVSGKIDADANVSTSTDIEGLYEGLKLTTKLELFTEQGKNTDNGVLGLEYKTKACSQTVTAKYLRNKPQELTASLVGVYQGVSFGGSAKVKAPTKGEKAEEAIPASLEDYELGARYDADKFAVAAVLSKKFTELKLAVNHQVNDKTTLVAEVAHTKAKPAKEGETVEASKPVFTVGTTYKIDNETTVSAKANTKLESAVNYAVKVNKNLEAAVTVRATLDDLKKNSKLGLAFTYEPKE